jgi:CHASE2 domain-containing sensor protein
MVRTLVRLGVLVAIGLVLFLSKHIAGHLEPWSQAIINGIVKYTYQPIGQEDTTVVLFLEQNLRDLNESYPVSYARHAEVLEALSIHPPRAIFIDFVFLDKRSEQATQLRDAICGLRKAGTTVYVAVLDRVLRPLDPGSVLACAVQVSAQMEGADGASGVLRYANGVSPSGGGEFLPTAAFEMASARLGVDPRNAQEMELIWGNGVADLNRKWMKGCARRGSWWAHLRGLRDKSLKGVKLLCPYTRTITVGHVLGSSDDPDVVKALKERTVFYGAAFHLTGDRVASPVFDELPGVYLHAMAYDNLRTLEKDYKRADRPLFRIPILADGYIVLRLTAVIEIVLLFVTVGILLLVEEPPPALRKFRERFARTRTWLKWLILGLSVLPLGIAMATGTGLWAVGLGLPLLMAAIAFLDLAPPAERPPHTLQEFVARRLLALIVPILAILIFIAVDRGVGLEAALLMVALPAYFLYRVGVARDMLFAATSVLLVLAAVVIVLPPVNLGPRNVLAYVTFFEVARRLLKHADHVAVQYAGLRDQHPRDREWGWAEPIMPALDWVFAVCRRTSIQPDVKTELQEETHGKTAGAPA